MLQYGAAALPLAALGSALPSVARAATAPGGSATLNADGVAHTILQAAYPGRNVVQLNIDEIARGGGGIHCGTQSQPVVPPAV